MTQEQYTTQMDAARKGIFTPEINLVAKKENMPPEKLIALVFRRQGCYPG